VARRIGLDVHREFAQVAVWEDGVVRQAGQIATTPEALRAFADSVLPDDEVAIEATCNTHAIVKLIAPRVARVVISNPMKTRAIAEARVKTDKVDAAILAQLLAAGARPRRRVKPGLAESMLVEAQFSGVGVKVLGQGRRSHPRAVVQRIRSRAK
jgi:transposase